MLAERVDGRISGYIRIYPYSKRVSEITLIQQTAQIIYRKHQIAAELWDVNGKQREVFTIDGAHAPDGHFDPLADAK